MSVFAAAATFLLLALGACFDARWRRFPNWLAVACAVAAVGTVFARGGVYAAGRSVVIAVFICSALVLFELFWRRARGSSGLGLGDVKALFSLVVLSPVAGLAAFAVSLLLLALVCVATKRPSLPLLPFLVPVFAIMSFMGTVIA